MGYLTEDQTTQKDHCSLEAGVPEGAEDRRSRGSRGRAGLTAVPAVREQRAVGWEPCLRRV